MHRVDESRRSNSDGCRARYLQTVMNMGKKIPASKTVAELVASLSDSASFSRSVSAPSSF